MAAQSYFDAAQRFLRAAQRFPRSAERYFGAAQSFFQPAERYFDAAQRFLNAAESFLAAVQRFFPAAERFFETSGRYFMAPQSFPRVRLFGRVFNHILLLPISFLHRVRPCSSVAIFLNRVIPGQSEPIVSIIIVLILFPRFSKSGASMGYNCLNLNF